MKKWLLMILVGTALVLGACGGGDDDQTSEGGSSNGDAADAEAIYKSNCTACHGADLSGGAGPSLETIGASLSADEIADIIENGTGNMGPQNVSADDREVLSEWLAAKK